MMPGTRRRVYATGLLTIGLSVPASSVGQRIDTVVKNVAAPRHAGVATLVPDLRIGMVDGPPEYLFGGPSEILGLRNGSVVVIDWAGDMGAPIVRRYDGNGKFIGNLGRVGEGPGEYRGPTGLAESPDGRIVLSDPRLRRVTYYRADGAVDTVVSVSAYSYAIRGVDHVKVGPDGVTYLRFSTRTERNAPSLIDILRIGKNGTIIDTIKPPPLPDYNPPRLTATAEGGRGTYSTSVSYWPRAVWALSPNGYFVTSDNNRYSIDVRQGNRVLTIRRDVAPVQVSATERDEQRNYKRDWLRFYGTFTGTVPETPRTKPFFQSLTVFEDGRIWASLSTPSERYEPPPRPVGDRNLPPLRWREPHVFDVFEPDGTYVGQVSVPYGVYLSSVRGDLAWGFTRGDEDVPYVIRYRIAWRR